MTMLDQSNDPNHPRERARWHRVPRWLHWLCWFLSSIAGAAGYYRDLKPELLARQYDFSFFRLTESKAGNWFIKWG